MVGAPHRREGDLGVGRPDRDPQRGGRGALGVRGRVRVAHDQTFALQHDGLRVVLRPDGQPRQHENQQHGRHHGQRPEPGAHGEPRGQPRPTGGRFCWPESPPTPGPRSSGRCQWLDRQRCRNGGGGAHTSTNSVV